VKDGKEMTQEQAEVLATQDFINTVMSAVENLAIYPRLNVHLDRVMLVLLLRCVRTVKSVCVLAEQQSGLYRSDGTIEKSHGSTDQGIIGAQHTASTRAGSTLSGTDLANSDVIGRLTAAEIAFF
jgi:hypothetical protein